MPVVKARSLIALALLLAGCHRPSNPPQAALTADEAGALARQLANEKADASFHCRPFSDGPAPQLVQGHWVWHDRQGLGHNDFEASVQFRADGTAPAVSVTLLESRSGLPLSQ